MYQNSLVRTYSKNQTPIKIKKVQYILLYQTNASLMGRLTRIELANDWFTASCVSLFTTAAI